MDVSVDQMMHSRGNSVSVEPMGNIHHRNISHQTNVSQLTYMNAPVTTVMNDDGLVLQN